MDLVAVASDLGAIHGKIHQMPPALGHVAAAVSQGIQPGSIRKVPVHPRVDSSLPDLLIGDAGKVRFTRNTRSEAGVQSVIPDIQLLDVRRISGGYEIDRYSRSGMARE